MSRLLKSVRNRSWAPSVRVVRSPAARSCRAHNLPKLNRLPMKIVDIITTVVNAQMRNWVFVKVVTDQPGLYGWGEATLEWKTRAVVGVIEDLKPLVLGRDP